MILLFSSIDYFIHIHDIHVRIIIFTNVVKLFKRTPANKA